MIAVIGGGIFGTGVARDLSLRGFEVCIIEKNEIGSGTTSKTANVLHSGVRYSVTDPKTAKECAQENKILHKIAPNYLKEMNSFFVALNNEDDEYLEKMILNAKKARVKAEEVTSKEILNQEPLVNNRVIRGVKSNDTWVNATGLCKANCKDIQVIKEKVININDLEVTTNKRKLKTELIINAAGVEVKSIAKLAGFEINYNLSRGTILELNKKLTNKMVVRASHFGYGTIPQEKTSYLGTTQSTLTSSLENDVKKVVKECSEVIPSVKSYKISKIITGTRVLLNKEKRGFDIIDHGGILSILGGKLTTYRLIAEKVGNLVCKKLGSNKKCVTHKTRIE